MCWLLGTLIYSSLQSCPFFSFLLSTKQQIPPFPEPRPIDRTYLPLPVHPAEIAVPALFLPRQQPIFLPPAAWPGSIPAIRYVSALWDGARPSSLSSWAGTTPGSAEAALRGASVALGQPSICFAIESALVGRLASVDWRPACLSRRLAHSLLLSKPPLVGFRSGGSKPHFRPCRKVSPAALVPATVLFLRKDSRFCLDEDVAAALLLKPGFFPSHSRLSSAICICISLCSNS